MVLAPAGDARRYRAACAGGRLWWLGGHGTALGGLIVAGVLKYADSVLKGYATAISVIMTGLLSMFLFGTQLHVVYFMGIVNVVIAVLLYNGKNLDQFMC